MKRVYLPLSRLSLAQKLDLMETLWADLTRDEKKLESPAWHEIVLRDRAEAFSVGKVTVSDWAQAKKRIKKLRPLP
ncbi:MAG: addiction module protein [Thermodesulfobacteriota bacterium]